MYHFDRENLGDNPGGYLNATPLIGGYLIGGLANPGAIPNIYFQFLPDSRGHADWRLRNPVCIDFCRKKEYYQ